MEEKDRDVAAELLKVGLKLTKERMDAITSYVFCPPRSSRLSNIKLICVTDTFLLPHHEDGAVDK